MQDKPLNELLKEAEEDLVILCEVGPSPFESEENYSGVIEDQLEAIYCMEQILIGREDLRQSEC